MSKVNKIFAQVEKLSSGAYEANKTTREERALWHVSISSLAVNYHYYYAVHIFMCICKKILLNKCL